MSLGNTRTEIFLRRLEISSGFAIVCYCEILLNLFILLECAFIKKCALDTWNPCILLSSPLQLVLSGEVACFSNKYYYQRIINVSCRAAS